jgi:YebC/PmpR family DNA-binding regulatory protein
MSGHSKWAKIKYKKERSDAKKGKIFTKLGKEIMVAVKQGGGDPENNSKLRDVIAKAKAANMPNDTIKRSISKAAGTLEGVNYEEIVYEGYGPGGVAFIVDTMTENKNRTAADVRHFFDKCGGSLGATGCVGWMFDRRGVIVVEKEGAPEEDEVMMMALDSGAEDFVAHEEVYEILTDPTDFSNVREALEKQNISFLSADIQRIPQNTVEVSGEMTEKILKLIDLLEDNDDVQNIHHNAEIDE